MGREHKGRLIEAAVNNFAKMEARIEEERNHGWVGAGRTTRRSRKGPAKRIHNGCGGGGNGLEESGGGVGESKKERGEWIFSPVPGEKTLEVAKKRGKT